MTPQALAATHAAAFPESEAWSAAAFSALLAQPACRLTGDVRSFVLIRIVLDEAEVLTLATHPDHRRQGLAAAALAAALAAAATAGATRMHLEVAADNAAALALYARAGFAPTGRRRAYYRRPGAPAVDALLMARALPPDSAPDASRSS